jgi:membrane associated rhomboid family serine protease
MSQPDLFVVCKNCGSEVSPYVTECPYCGQRVRKRAPKIGKGAEEPKPKRARRPSLPRLRPDEIPGIAPETKPYATFALIVASLALSVVLATGEVSAFDLGGIFGPVGDEVWRYFAAPFVHDNAGYQFIALVATAIFGMHIERRFGWFPAVAIFVIAGAAGAAASDALEMYPVLGANGAALGLLCAWLVDDRMARRRGVDRENDLIGVYVIAAALLLLSLAEEDATIAAAVGGALTGALLGLVLTTTVRR